MNENPKNSVLVSGRARDMLYEHACFLAQVSVKAGEEQFDQFEEKITSLEEIPERCSYYYNPYIRSGKYQKLALGNYLLILFQVVNNTVYIDLIIDARAENRDIP